MRSSSSNAAADNGFETSTSEVSSPKPGESGFDCNMICRVLLAPAAASSDRSVKWVARVAASLDRSVKWYVACRPQPRLAIPRRSPRYARGPSPGGSRGYFTNCGINVRGSQSIRDGNNITINSTSSMGMKRMAVSFTASLILMPPMEQAIIRHRPYGGVTRP